MFNMAMYIILKMLQRIKGAMVQDATLTNPVGHQAEQDHTVDLQPEGLFQDNRNA
jgi:hypothetical protein